LCCYCFTADLCSLKMVEKKRPKHVGVLYLQTRF
jgi:hypothetical protein